MEDASGDFKIVHKLIITRNNYEFRTKGSIEELKASIDEIVTFLVDLNEKLRTSGILAESLQYADLDEELPEEEIRTAPTDKVPVIKATRRTRENIVALFSTEWGKKERTSSEVIKALEINSVPDQSGTVRVYLKRLVQKGLLRRTKRGNIYHYVKILGTE
jgi:hypothetical protein